MQGRRGNTQPWTAKGRTEAIQQANVAKAEHAKALLAKLGARRQPEITIVPPQAIHLSRPSQEPLRFRRTLHGTNASADAFTPVLVAMAETAQDQRDRSLLAWPCRPDNGFVAAALHLLEGRVKGLHVAQAVGLWPWRTGITHASRSILVQPEGLVRYARAAAQDRFDGATWTKGKFGENSHEMALMRLDDLRKEQGTDKSGVTVRLPSLFELTSVFEPTLGFTCYLADDSHFLQRVRRHTQMGQRGGLTTKHVQDLGDPLRAPLAVFGLPAHDSKKLAQCLVYKRFADHRLDLVIADLTHTALSSVGERWPEAFLRLLAALERLGTARPGLVVLAEDAFVYKRADTMLREAAYSSRPRRSLPETRGVMLSTQGFLGLTAPRDASYPVMEVRADLKDARLLSLRNEVLGAARQLDEAEDRTGAAALRAGLSFVRATATLPIALGAARSIVEMMHGTEDDADRRVRRKFYTATALQPMADAALASPNRALLLAFRARFMALAEGWENATPVSEKLAALAARLGDDARKTMLVLPDRHVANIYDLSDAAQAAPWHVAEPRTMVQIACAHGCDRWIVVRTSGDTLRTLLTALPGPSRLDLIGDAAGTALLEAELRPVATLEAFSSLKARAEAFRKAIGQSLSSLTLDHEEMSARTVSNHAELDFTRSDGEYAGPRIRVETEGGYILFYRPTSDVLRYTPDDLRAFDKVQAQLIRPTDAVLVLTLGLMELLRRELARAPKTVETLRQYHAEVGRKRLALPGTMLMDKARALQRAIKAAHPEFGDHEATNVARWLSVDKTTLDDPSSQPQAPRTRGRFDLFMTALDIHPTLTDAWWKHGIRLTRSYRLSEGMQFNQRAIAFVVDPESMALRNTGLNAAALRHAITENTDTVKRVEVINDDRK